MKRQHKLDGANASTMMSKNASTKKATTRTWTKLDGLRFLQNLATPERMDVIAGGMSICSAAHVYVYALYNVYVYQCSTVV